METKLLNRTPRLGSYLAPKRWKRVFGFSEIKSDLISKKLRNCTDLSIYLLISIKWKWYNFVYDIKKKQTSHKGRNKFI